MYSKNSGRFSICLTYVTFVSFKFWAATDLVPQNSRPSTAIIVRRMFLANIVRIGGVYPDFLVDLPKGLDSDTTFSPKDGTQKVP